MQLDTCLSSIELQEFLDKVVHGLSDDSDEIKVLSHMMLSRLAQASQPQPATGSSSSSTNTTPLIPISISLALIQRLDEMTPVLETTMKGPAVTKDTVKQDLERTAALQRSALRAVAALNRIYPTRRSVGRTSDESPAGPPGIAPKFEAFVANLQANFKNELKELGGGL